MMNTRKTCKRGHLLQPRMSNDGFNCSYCLEIGTGPRFSCVECKYNVHRDCALASSSRNHPFIPDHVFTLSNIEKYMRACVACGSLVQRNGYHCEATRECLHPCCAYLTKRTTNDEGYDLFLDNKMSSNCELCDRKDPGWCYRTKNKDKYSHVSCMKEKMIVSLQNQIFSKSRKDRFHFVRPLILQASEGVTLAEKKRCTVSGGARISAQGERSKKSY